MKLKLFTMPGSCSLSDHIALNWSGLPYEIQIIKLGETKSPEFLKLNPSGAVPLLLVDGYPLAQNVAILNFIADSAPQAKLGGDGSALGRAKVNQWLALINSDLHPTFESLFGGMKYLEDENAIAKAQEVARNKLRGIYARIDKQLAGHDWLLGERSIVDAYLFVVLRWAKYVQLDLEGLNNLESFFKRMSADAGVQKALKEESI